ncbi:multidrug efflux RND transporter permease subunit [Parabacteroides sp. 52]|uniref:multidrug efflux RND transporter permease subunit n=1 Tax=unclassified Parabacteroides TaxID=2649774 RepID=UPI0013D8847E|nr:MULTISPECIES: multidrug efflux RND transporter permease subunit [unclassified Parabacteroides]MDH6533847.1 hydrophobe/amphiphile efflux-1 (HAE1) family protein/NodT family efflux transporter outer membrane factor (OMF) lipoprotein [Parabacteroides sp. PM5-20]NDV54594.1 multidrug efflux RND transporter permease subunit [Parabacteroides sp. 52]
MKPGFFIDRPVFSTVLSILIVIVGIIGLIMLPIDQYPQITPPVVRINASYSGASALTVSQAVATPIEQELNGTPGMIYMQSSSSNSGGLGITVTFDVSTNADLAAVEIQNRVKLAESRLPAEVVQNGITIEKQAPSQLMTLSLMSDDPKFDEIYLSNFATVNVLDVLRRIPGVGRVSNVGSRYYGMQIWVYPDRLANMGLTVKDLQDALKDQNRESAAGELGKQPVLDVDITLPITAPGRLSTVKEFEDIVVRANSDGTVVRLRDVARVSLEASSYSTESGINGKNAAIMSIYMLPGANAMEVAEDVKQAMGEISQNFPEGLEYNIPFDMTEYISQSIHEVYKTLFEALLLVILVVFLSLQNWRAALIPTIAVPISLIGTFGFMLVMGFSLNMLTLLGLILAIGIVVDDAIVVVENVERLMEVEKLSAREATHKAMKELSGALIATSMVLAAVFVPVSFLGGITGLLYRQFSVTIVVSVLLSTVVALTLSPAMCAILLKPSSGRKNIVFQKINIWLSRGNGKYTQILQKAIAHPRRILAGFGVALVCIFVLNRALPTSFIPEEDQGFFTVELEMPEGTTLERTRVVTERAVQYLMTQPAVAYVQNVTGSSSRVGTSQGRAVLTVILKPWEERKSSGMKVGDVMDAARKEFYYYPEIKAYLNRPPVIPGLGESGGLEMQLEARGNATWDNLVSARDTFLYYASRAPEIQSISSAMQAEIPQLYFDVDRDRAKALGIPLSDIFSTMKAYLGAVYVNDFNMLNRIYRVYIQAEAPYRATQDNIGLFFVRASNGAMVPLTALGTTSYTTGPGTIKRFNMFNTASVNAVAAAGHSTGDAMAALERIAREHLPENIGVEWSGLSYQEKKAGGQTGFILALVFLFVFLFLAAQYESWIVPIAVLLSLPIAALGAYLGVWITGLENDVYFQIGLVTLIGLAAKNAILIVEFAKVQVDDGVDVVKAAIQAAQLRFRPILMTSLAFVLGMLPLVLASGPGSASRHSIGTGVFFGMLVAITVGIVMVPFFFVLIYKMKRKIRITKLYKTGIVILVAVSFSSCKVGKSYNRPELGIPADTVWSADSSSVSDLPWQSLYRDTVLQGLIHQALENNKDMRMAAAKIKEMLATKRISFANQFPEVNAKLNAQKEELNYGGDNRKSSQEFSGKLTLSWELDFWGRLRWASEADIAVYMQSVEAQRALQLTLVAEVATKYYELAALDQELSIVEQTLDARQEAVHLAKLRYEGGLTSQTAYNQAQVELARTETLIPALQRDIQIKENDLSFLLGEYDGTIPRSYTLAYENLPDTLPMGLSSDLLERRPDVRIAEQKLRAANARVGVAQADLFPRIALTGNLGGESNELSNLLKSPAWFIAGDLLQPLFAMGKNRARVKAAKARYEQEVYSYQKSVLEAFREVNNALVTSRKVKEIRRSRTALLDAAGNYMHMAQLQYINGITNYIDVLDAQRGLFDAQIGLNNAVLDEQLAIIRLYKALGGGYE